MTALTLPRLGFGTSALGDMPDSYGYGVDEARARATLQAVFAGPPALLDTSRNYGLGRSEQRIGAALKEAGGLPKGFVLSTKIDRDFETSRFDAARARRSLEESLTALGVSKVHVLHLHDPEHCASLAEVTDRNGLIAELFKMKAEGLCDAVGLAAGRVDLMMPLLRDWDFDALISHNRFTLLNRNAGPMFDLAKSRGTAVINAAPYASGLLAKGAASGARYAYQAATEGVQAQARAIEAICARYGVPTGAAALQFSMRDPRVANTLIGVTKPERVAETLAWAALKIPDACWAELSALPASSDDPEATRQYTMG
jgi:D-threo-aldose 1-dehydrogenase